MRRLKHSSQIATLPEIVLYGSGLAWSTRFR